MISFSRRNVDGKVVEEWQMYDSLDFMQQLGVIPKPKGR
jgi:predicted ester cyclase